MSSVSDTSRGGRGRGRGRGRGKGINTPAWMTKNDNLKRQVEQQQQQQPRRSQPETQTLQNKRESFKSKLKEEQGPNSKKARRRNPELEIIEDKLAAEIKRQEEEIKIQRQKEEEELARLAEQFGDAEDDDDANHGFGFEFEKEEEKEERLAGERREKRRNRSRGIQHDSPMVVQETNGHDSGGNGADDEIIMDHIVDRPRNPQGVIESEGGELQLQQQQQLQHQQQQQQQQQYHERNASADNANGKNNHYPIVVAENGDGKQSFDMFSSSSVSPPAPVKTISTTTLVGTGIDDAEGYYRATIGEIISFRPTTSSFRVSGIIGKGVFSTVLKCTCIAPTTQAQAQTLNNKDTDLVIAIKLIRSNEIMAKAAQKEVRILRLLNDNDNNNSKKKKQSNTADEKCIVKMFELDDFQDGTTKDHPDHKHAHAHASTRSSLLLEHHNHTALLFEHMPFNLRETLRKFGNNVGINLSAVRSYAKQLLTALEHLAAHRVVHADIKLDNILVSANFSTVKLCDFGSAFFETDTDNDPTPYLVSRFYRAPEIILGLEYDKKIDLWSVAVTLVELFTGSVLFAGRNNNDMLKKFIECIGPLSNKMIRRHILSFNQLGLQPHFETIAAGGSNYNFRKQEFDKVTGKPIIRVTSVASGTVSAKHIVQILLKSRSTTDNRANVIKFGEFLSKCLALDPQKRMNIEKALDHEFLCSKKKPEED